MPDRIANLVGRPRKEARCRRPSMEPKGIELIRLATTANRSRGSREEGGREK
jgi:hypothetical protein